MKKGDLAIDPRGLIYESYRIDGIVIEECRSIFLDWAMGQSLDVDMHAALNELKHNYVVNNPDHPMSQIILEGLNRQAVKTGRRRGRRTT